MREGMTELPGALSTKIKKIKTNEID
jgi:hypothetical protein